MSEEQKQEIIAFFQNVIVNGITREIVFLEHPEQGYIEVELRAPESVHMEPVYLSIPEK